MHTPLILALIAVWAAPAAAHAQAPRPMVFARADAAVQTDRERERLEREQADQERERARTERERERLERERARAQAQRERIERQRSGRRPEGPQETERTTRTLRIGGNGEIHVANVSGDIVITGGGGNEATVEIIKTARGSTPEEARAMLALVEVDVIERGTRAEVRTRYKENETMRRTNRRNYHVSVAFNVTVPPGTRVRANSVSGAITAKAIKGEIALESVSGTVVVANGGRHGTAKSISGNVEVSETDIEGALNASSASGNIVLRRVKARELELGSISGDVIMDEVDCPRIEAQTVSGGVRFNGSLARNSRYELNSHSGTVEIAISGGAGFEVEATSFSGSVRSDFPLKAQGGDDQPGHRQRSLRGVFGDGSAVLDLTTFSGSIVLSKR